jgi:CRISPR-associated protein Cas1
MKKDYYILKSGELKRKDFNIIHVDSDNKKTVLPIKTIDNLFIFNTLNINTDLINYLGDLSINTHFFDYYNNYKGSFSGKNLQHSGNTHVNQSLHYLVTEKRLYLAKEFVNAAMWGIHKNLLEYNIESDYFIDLEKLKNSKSINEVMGVEGNFRKKYYEKFDVILKNFKFVKRSKQPPENEINALISFGNSLCYNYCLNAIKQTYLNSTISYLHESGERRHSLCLDIAEIFKPILIDRIIFKLINKRSLTSCHFTNEKHFCYLNDNGKKIFIQEIEDKLKTTIFHRKLNKNVSYKTLIKIECYKLCKHILNCEKYESLKINW